VSVVVVNYNGEQFLQNCVDSILAQSSPPGEVIVVDNHSADRSLDILRSISDVRLTVLPLADNVGYPAGCNAGIQNSSGDLIAILNNDVVLEPDWLKTLLNHDSQEWSLWASRIEFASPPGVIDSAGDGMAVVGSAFKIGHGDPVDLHLETREVFGPCAAAALYRRSLLEAVGGFDPDFFLVYEDADLNFRARLMGFRCLYVADARVLHGVNTSIGTFTDSYVFHGHRNSEFVFWKNMPARLLLFYLPERALFNLFSLLFFLWKGRGTAFLQAKLGALRERRAITEKRKKIQQDSTVSSREVRRHLERNWLKYRRKLAGPS